MYNANTIKSELMGLIGWRQNEDANGYQLNGTLTGSTSGMLYNAEHPLLTMDDLISVAPEYSRIKGTPEEEETAFNTWLQRKTEDGIVRAVQSWLDSKFPKRTAKNLLKRSRLFEVAGRVSNLDDNDGKLAGLEITPRRGLNVVTNITQIGVQLSQNQDVTLYLFHSQKNTAVQSQLVNYNQDGGIQWVDVNWQLEGYGTYYVVFDQSSISGSTINGATDNNYENAGSTWFLGSRYVTVRAFAVTGGTASIWDIANNEFTTTTNYGLNLKLDVKCDYTEFITDQKDLFKTLVSKQVAIDLLREMAFNPNSRVNRNLANIKRSELLYEIDGDSQGRPGGLRKQHENALKSIQFDMTGIDKDCLPCRRRGINITAV